MKSGPLSIFLSESDNSVKLFKRPSKPLGSPKWPVPVDFGKQEKLKVFPPISPLGLKKKPIQASPGCVSRGALLSSRHPEPGRLAAGDSSHHSAGQERAGGLGSCLVITLPLPVGIPDGYLGRRQAGDE